MVPRRCQTALDGITRHQDVTRRHSNCTKTVLDGITRRQKALDGARKALHGAKTALDSAWYHCWGAVAGALVLVRWCDGVGAAAKW